MVHRVGHVPLTLEGPDSIPDLTYLRIGNSDLSNLMLGVDGGELGRHQRSIDDDGGCIPFAHSVQWGGTRASTLTIQSLFDEIRQLRLAFNQYFKNSEMCIYVAAYAIKSMIQSAMKLPLAQGA